MSNVDTSKSADEASAEVILKVGGTKFLLERSTIDQLQSPFLSKLMDPDTQFKKPADGLYVVEADAECFSAFVNMTRYGYLPLTLIDEKEKDLLQEAAFWGVDSKVRAQVEETKRRAKVSKCRVDLLMYKSVELRASQKHCNYRKDDGAGRIYCVECKTRDMDSRWCVDRKLGYGGRYANCKKCNKTVNYRPDLGWCHKCRMCRSCQDYGGCPADDNMNCHGHSNKPTTAELKAEVGKLLNNITM